MRMENGRRDKNSSSYSVMGQSGWSDLGDSSVLRLLDEPFDMEKDSSQLRNDEMYNGFDENTGNTWIYPTNFPIRSYQFTITKASLFKNTLVVLPTGLGKTFIAAVVMYNIYRWYPTGKVIFMAPTRPLVSQQIEACRNVMGITLSDTAEMTGHQNKKLRRELWATKRIFFATPQVVQSDIGDVGQEFPFSAIKLLVVDEAHKAKGRYAYTEVVRSIAARNPYFRVLALSATPGRQVEDVIEVVRNLLISHLEIRWENCFDVSSYTHKKHIKIMAVAPGKDLTAIRNEFIEIIEPYLRCLTDNNVLVGNLNLSNLTKGRLIMEQKRFREICMRERHPSQAMVSTNFSICVSLFHALELLERHGTRVFLNFFDDNSNDAGSAGSKEKFFVTLNPTLKSFLEKLRNYVGPNPFSNCDLSMTLGRYLDLPKDFDFGHPKYEIAKNILLNHFKTDDDESRAIVFCEYRESVLLLYHLLQQNTPQIKSRIFVGQGGTGTIRAVTQKEQMEVMNDFRKGTCNTLIATSVAEEGIDVGEVDLIICFDISTKNPTRFTQRIGRTGRKKQGSVIMLTTEGKEYSVAKEVLATKDKTNQKIAKSCEVTRMLYKNSPRLVPPEYNPKCQETKMEITAEEPTPEKRRSKIKTDNKGNRGRKPLNNNHGTDVRKYFTKMQSAENKLEQSYITQEILPDEVGSNNLENNNSLEENSTTSNSLPQEKLATTKKKLSRKIGAISKKLNKILHKPELISPKNVIISNSSSYFLKRLVLEKNPEYVKEKYEAMKAVRVLNETKDQLGEDAISLMDEYNAIEKVFGSEAEIEKFLMVKRNEVKSSHNFDIKFGKLFEGLQNRDLDDDVDVFIDEKLNEFKEEMSYSVSNETEHYQEYPVSTDLVGNCLNKAIDYSFESEIKAQSTPFKKAVSNQACRKSPLKGRTLLQPSNSIDPKEFIEQTQSKFDENIFNDEFEDFEVVHNNSKDYREMLSNLQSNKIEQNDKPHNNFKDYRKFINNLQNNKLEGDDINVNLQNNQVQQNEHNANLQNSEIDQNGFHVLKKENNIELIKSQCDKSVDDFFDDDFDEVIACSYITQIERKYSLSNLISLENVKLNSAVEDKNLEIERRNLSGVEMGYIDLNDFLEPFDAEIDEGPLAHTTHQGDINSSHHIESCAQPLGVYNKSDDSTNKSKAVRNTSTTPTRDIAETKSGTSPSLFSNKANLTKLKFISLSGQSSAKAKEELKENYYQRNNAIEDIPTCSQHYQSQANDESVIAPRMKRHNKAIASSESETEESINNSAQRKQKLIARKNRRRAKKLRCDFIDDEAMVSGEDSDDYVDISYEDGMSQFVVDTMIAEEEEGGDSSTINMQAKYLESIRSPKRHGKFKIPEMRNFMNMSQIFSQPVLQESMTAYKEDSFVVSDEEDVLDGELTQICPLEQAEAILKAKRKAKRMGLEFCSITSSKNKPKVWKNLKQFSDSSEEETS